MKTRTRVTDAEIATYWQPVSCQRLFVRGKGSSYLRVEEVPAETHADPRRPALAPTQIVLDLMHATEQIYQASQQVEQSVIHAGAINEGNPWLERTQWAIYLEGIPPDHLLRLVETPDKTATGPEALVRRLWDTMYSLACVCQRVTRLTGHSLRVEAARVEPGKRPSQPLKAYMTEDRMKQYVEPWQQILVFFARTKATPYARDPQYRFSRTQQAKWDRLWQQIRYWAPDKPSPEDLAPTSFQPLASSPQTDLLTLAPTQSACLEFCISLLNAAFKKDEYDLALVCALAILGRRTSGWKDEESYPPILSKVIKISRFMVLYRALLLDPKAKQILRHLHGRAQSTDFWEVETPLEIPDISLLDSRQTTPSEDPELPSYDSDYSGSDPDLPATHMQRAKTQHSFREWLTNMMNQFMLRGTFSPLEYMLDIRSYGLKVHYSTTAEGYINWISHDELSYQHLTFSLGDLRACVHGLTSATAQILLDELLLCEESQVPSIPWDSIKEDPNQSAARYSFLQDPRTKWPVDGEQWLLQHVVTTKDLQRRFFDHKEKQWRLNAIKRYLRSVVRFREKLAVLVHMTAGQPARAPELLSLRHRNTETGRRNVFVADGLVSFVSRYHKGFYLRNDSKLIHRFVPRVVGTLVVRYLWLVLPFANRIDTYYAHLTQQARTKVPSQDTLIWSPDPATMRDWDSDRFSQCLRRETAIGLRGQRINIPAYRHIAIGISRRFLRSSAAFPQNVHDDNPDWSYEETEDTQDSEHFAGHYLDLQAAHSSHVAGMIYGREATEHAGSTISQREHYRLSSTDWHRLLGFDSIEDPLTRLVRRQGTDPWETELSQLRFARRFELQQAKLASTLQHFLGSTLVRFRGIQEAVLQGIQFGQSPIAAVMPTGAGKSLLFMLPAFLTPSGLTVVIVPIIALRIDLQARCTKLGIRCVTWVSRRPADDASIVLVTPEAALTADFMTFLHRQNTLCRLDRIVIDECHILLQPGSSFRTKIKFLGQVLTFGAQVLLLTATLPPSLEYRLWQRLRVQRAQVHLYRSRTTRANLSYYVWRPLLPRGFSSGSDWLTMPSTLDFVRQRIQLASPGRTVIYTTTRGHVETLASYLKCEAFHSQSYDKDGIIERFQTGDSKVLVATGSFGLGIDISDIRCVLHLGWPRSLLDYSQESGRAGRDGLPSEAILIQPQGDDRPPPWFQPEADQSVTEIHEFESDLDIVRQYITSSSVCRRVLLDNYLDGPPAGLHPETPVQQESRTFCGETSVGTLLEEALCDHCDPQWYHRTKSALTMKADIEHHPHLVAIIPPPPTPRGSKRPLDQPTSPFHGQTKRARPSKNPPTQGPTTDPIPSSQFWHAVNPYPLSRTTPATLELSARTIADSQSDPPISSVTRDSTSSDAGSFESQAPLRSLSLEPQAGGIVRSQGLRSDLGPPPPLDRVPECPPVPASDPPSPEGLIPLVVRHQFRAQDQSRVQLGSQWHRETETALLDEEFLDQQAHLWKDCCWTCHMSGRDDNHELYSCPYPENTLAREWYRQWRSKIRYAPMCACFRCGMPQRLCQGWDRTKDPPIPCLAQYVLLPMYAMMMYGETKGLSSTRHTFIRISRYSWRNRLRSFEVDPDDSAAVVRFLGQETRQSIYRQVELATAFIWLRRAFLESGVEKPESTEE